MADTKPTELALFDTKEERILAGTVAGFVVADGLGAVIGAGIGYAWGDE